MSKYKIIPDHDDPEDDRINGGFDSNTQAMAVNPGRYHPRPLPDARAVHPLHGRLGMA